MHFQDTIGETMYLFHFKLFSLKGDEHSPTTGCTNIKC